MTYLDLIRDADRQLDDGRITLGEYEKMIEPLNREIDHIAESGKKVEQTAEIAQNVQNGDLILRKAAIELIGRMKPYHQDADDIAEMIANMPSAQPELETVECIIGGSYMDIGDADFSMKCAKCGAEYYHVEDYEYEYNFCPNCGRRWRRQDG